MKGGKRREEGPAVRNVTCFFRRRDGIEIADGARAAPLHIAIAIVIAVAAAGRVGRPQGRGGERERERGGGEKGLRSFAFS